MTNERDGEARKKGGSPYFDNVGLPRKYIQHRQSCPGGTPENSPTFQRWVWPPAGTSPVGTAEKMDDFSRPYGTQDRWVRLRPTLKRLSCRASCHRSYHFPFSVPDITRCPAAPRRRRGTVWDANGVIHTSPGQRPGFIGQRSFSALRARFIVLRDWELAESARAGWSREAL